MNKEGEVSPMVNILRARVWSKAEGFTVEAPNLMVLVLKKFWLI